MITLVTSPKQHLPKDMQHSVPRCEDKTPTYLLCKGIQSLAKRVFWMGGNRQHPNGSIVRNYSFAEIIGKSGIYFYDTIRVGLFVQAPWNDYPAHAHDSEEWLVLIDYVLYFIYF